jgi:hypothetical protein
MILVYLDESQQTEHERHVVLAGFCGTEEQWRAFEPVWKTRLLPRQKLHLNELRWNAKRSNRVLPPFLSRLAPTPFECGLRPIVSAVRVSDYHDLVRDLPPLRRRLTGYHVCLAAVLANLMVRYPGREQIQVILEAQAQSAYWAAAVDLLRCFRQICEVTHPYFDSIRREHKGQNCRMEAADFLAFAVGKDLDERDSNRARWCYPILDCVSAEDVPQMVMSGDRARQNVMDVMRDRFDKVLAYMRESGRWPADLPIEFRWPAVSPIFQQVIQQRGRRLV